jgi:hypothetical protein
LHPDHAHWWPEALVIGCWLKGPKLSQSRSSIPRTTILRALINTSLHSLLTAQTTMFAASRAIFTRTVRTFSTSAASLDGKHSRRRK